MKQDIQKFIDLLKTDASLQERMKSGAEKYDGEKTPEGVLLNPDQQRWPAGVL